MYVCMYVERLYGMQQKRWPLLPSMFPFLPRLLLYLSLFGCTLEPRSYRSRFHPPRRFLQHLDLTARLKSQFLAHRHLTSNTSSNTANSAASPISPGGGATPPSGSSPAFRPQDPAPQNSERQSTDVRYTWEYSQLLPATPEEIRQEVEILLSDLVVRLKQLLFNSLLCAYYVGFIPMQFADVSSAICNHDSAVPVPCSLPLPPHRATPTMTGGGVWNMPSWCGPTPSSCSPLTCCLPATARYSTSAPCILAAGPAVPMTTQPVCEFTSHSYNVWHAQSLSKLQVSWQLGLPPTAGGLPMPSGPMMMWCSGMENPSGGRGCRT